MKKIDGTQNMRRLFSRPNIIPLYGIMLAIILTLSIIYTTTMKSYHHVDLPETGYNQEDFEKCEITVSIDANGRIWLEECMVDDESEFTGLLQDLVEEKRSIYRICLNADKDILYEKIEMVLKAAQEADVDTVGLILTPTVSDDLNGGIQ